MMSSIAAAVVLVCWGGLGKVSSFTALLAVVFGIVTALAAFSGLRALEYGPWSYTSVVCSFSTLIPAFSGVLVWKEKFYLSYLLGIFLMCACFVLSVDLKGEKKSASGKWLMYCIVTFLGTGGIGIMQKWHQNAQYKEELNGFIIIAMLISAVYSLVWILIANRKEKIRLNTAFQSPYWPCLFIVTGAAVAINNKLNLYLSGTMDSAVFFPIVNGGGLILTILASALLFRERLAWRQWIGVAIGIVSVLIICNPIF